MRPERARTTAALVVVAGLAFVGGILVTVVVLGAAALSGVEAKQVVDQVLYGLVIGSLAVGGFLTMILYFAAGLRSGDRGGAYDFAVIAGSCVAGSLLALTVLFVLGAPIQDENKAIQATVAENRRIMQGDAEAFDAEFDAETGGAQLLSFTVMARDPGLKGTRRKIARSREVVARYRALHASRLVENRARLSKVLKNGNRRKALLDSYDQEVLAARPQMDRYWDLQDRVMADIDIAVSHLARSPGRWGPRGYIFNREVDFGRSSSLFRQVDARTTELQALSLEIRYGLTVGRQPAVEPGRN